MERSWMTGKEKDEQGPDYINLARAGEESGF